MVRRIVRKLRRALWTVRWQGWNRFSTRHECYVCKRRLRHFYPWLNGLSTMSEFIRQMEVVGSDVVNFGCPFCYANDRERHLFLYFDRLKVWDRFCGKAILHFAPERNLSRRIKQCGPSRYVQADFFPEDLYSKNPEIERVDATDIQYGADTFDGLICNHVLEHVPDARKALSEFRRVLKPGGFAVLQTPFSARLAHTIEDSGIDTDELRQLVYGQEDHVRLFGRDFLGLIEEAGLSLELCRHQDVATTEEARRFGMNAAEDLILVRKPGHTA